MFVSSDAFPGHPLPCGHQLRICPWHQQEPNHRHLPRWLWSQRKRQPWQHLASESLTLLVTLFLAVDGDGMHHHHPSNKNLLAYYMHMACQSFLFDEGFRILMENIKVNCTKEKEKLLPGRVTQRWLWSFQWLTFYKRKMLMHFYIHFARGTMEEQHKVRHAKEFKQPFPQ